MVNRHELENLDFMLENGMMNKKVYNCHKKALQTKHKMLHQTNLSKIEYSEFSILKSLKYSFNRNSFIATFLFLLISSIVLLSLYRIIWQTPNSLAHLGYFLSNQKIKNGVVFYLTTSALYAFWQVLWFTLFAYLSFNSLRQTYGFFSFKKFLKKSLVLFIVTTSWFSIVVSLYSIFIIHVLKQPPGAADFSHMSATQIVFFIFYFVITCAISYVFTCITLSLCGPLQKRLLEKSFYKGLKNPLFILKFWMGVVINLLLMSALFYGTQQLLYPFYKFSIQAILNAHTLTSLSSLLFLFITYGLIFVFIPKRNNIWLKLSLLFFIPSTIIYSMFEVKMSTQTTIVFFSFMHIIWVYFYFILFFTIQGTAFMSHLLTQTWCNLMSGEFITHKDETAKKERKIHPTKKTFIHLYRKRLMLFYKKRLLSKKIRPLYKKTVLLRKKAIRLYKKIKRKVYARFQK